MIFKNNTKKVHNKKSSKCLKKTKPPAKAINLERCRTQLNLLFERCPRGGFLKLEDAKKLFDGPCSKNLSIVFQNERYLVKSFNYCNACDKLATHCTNKNEHKRNRLQIVKDIRVRGIPTRRPLPMIVQSSETVEYSIKEPQSIKKELPLTKKELSLIKTEQPLLKKERPQIKEERTQMKKEQPLIKKEQPWPQTKKEQPQIKKEPKNEPKQEPIVASQRELFFDDMDLDQLQVDFALQEDDLVRDSDFDIDSNQKENESELDLNAFMNLDLVDDLDLVDAHIFDFASIFAQLTDSKTS
eukprot:m.63736 g.63736  ORF g.63736 m.63736 type:complete len:299 (-) comp23334_c0_seq1:131-1027(-)